MGDFEVPSATIKATQSYLKRIVSDPVYDTQSSTITNCTPEIAFKTTVRNDSNSDDFTESLTYTYVVSETGSWTDTLGGSVAIKASFEVGIPKLAEGKVEVTVTPSYSHTWEGSDSLTKTVTSTSAVAVPPKKKAIATVLVYKAIIDVPFSYIESTWYVDGTYEEVTKPGGVYNNVESYQVDIDVKDWDDV
jgi:hypothetical protein